MCILRNSLPRVLSHAMGVIPVLLWGFGTYVSAREAKNQFTERGHVEVYVDNLTGLGKLDGVTKCFGRADVNEDSTPFLHRQIVRKKNVWHVRIENVRLKLKSAASGFEDNYVRNFEILIDPNTGHMLGITSKFDGNDPNMLPEPPPAVAEAQMMVSKEIYHGFPPESPKISFHSALDAVLTNGLGSPYVAKEIYALYVMHSEMGSKPRPVWVITLRGLPPFSPIGPPGGLPKGQLPPVWQRNRMRNVVDAITGKVVSATNIPLPVDPEKKKRQ